MACTACRCRFHFIGSRAVGPAFTPKDEHNVANGDLNWITNYIWGIADDVLRDLYVRGKYRDVILPMTVLRRLDAVLEDGKQPGMVPISWTGERD